MKFLNRACNGVGFLRQKRKDQLLAYFRNPAPSAADFEAIADLVINMKSLNVRGAVEAIDPSFKSSDRVPDGFTVARALKLALKA
jgi:hypothetical protein